MAIERTLSIIKPDAVAKNVIGKIYQRFEDAGLKVVASKMAHLSEREAGEFYAVHKARPFYKDLVSFMTSGPVMIQVLEGEGAIAKNRELMGATNPKGSGRRYDPCRFRRIHRRQRGSWFRCGRNRGRRDRVLLPRHERLFALSCHSAGVSQCRPGRSGRLRYGAPELQMVTPVNLLDFDVDGLCRVVRHDGREAVSRARQVMRWMHREGCAEFSQMTDVAKSLRARLERDAVIAAPQPVRDSVSVDGTRKWLLDVGGRNAVEAVFIPETRRGTLCISSQAGCALDCSFCSTGKQGFNRNLSAGEIIGQLWLAESTARRSERR